MTRPRRLTAVVVGLVCFGAACSDGGSTAPPGSTSTSTSIAVDEGGDSTGSTIAPVTTTTIDPASLADLGGTIAVAGGEGIAFLRPTGDVVGIVAADSATAAQPTFSRDGARLIATVFDGAGQASTVVAGVDGELIHQQSARRPYFFYSWAPTGDFIAALGPGPLGTSLDILTPDGVPIHDVSLDTGSFYLAWEPGGDQLLVHLDDTLALVRDVRDLTAINELGRPGQRFLAPAWIPGSRAALVVDAADGAPRLTRIDVDTGEVRDLGPIGDAAGIQVAPDGRRALLAHNDQLALGGNGITTVAFTESAGQAIEPAPGPEITASTEVVDLPSGDRWPVGDDLTLWAEWSPAGQTVALLQASPGDGAVHWTAWSDGFAREFPPFTPSIAIFQSYLPFAWQFTESPRIWSPGSDALVYTAFVAGEPIVYVQRLTDAGPARLGVAPVAFWAPAS